jgi:hypothetical protein
MERRVIVTGSRTWHDRKAVWVELDRQLLMCDRLTVVWGRAYMGADRHAGTWTGFGRRPKVIIPEPHPADWDKYRKAAGMIRNTEMVALGADACLAFLMPCMLQGCLKSGGRHHWTHGGTDCADKAAAAGIPVIYRYGERND